MKLEILRKTCCGSMKRNELTSINFWTAFKTPLERKLLLSFSVVHLLSYIQDRFSVVDSLDSCFLI